MLLVRSGGAIEWVLGERGTPVLAGILGMMGWIGKERKALMGKEWGFTEHLGVHYRTKELRGAH